MVIHGLLDTCSFVFSKCLFAFQSGFEKVSFKISVRLLYQSSRVFEKLLFESFFERCQCEKKFLICFEIRPSIYESSTHPKELGCVNVL